MTDKEKLTEIKEFVERARDRHKRSKNKALKGLNLDNSYTWHYAKELEDERILQYINSLLD